MSATSPTSIRLDQIETDDSLQVREYIDGNTVSEYKLLMREGQLPPIDVFKIGSKYLLAGGWHRLEAARDLKWIEIECNVHEGDRRAAVLFAAGGNAHHGRPLTRNEKREAVKTLLPDGEWFQWSNARIGRHCGLSAPTVATIRDHFINEQARSSAGSRGSLKNSLSDKRKRIDRYGNVSTISTANIGRKPVTQKKPHHRDIDPHRVIEETVLGLAGYALGIRTWKKKLIGVDYPEVSEWASSLSESLETLNWLRDQLMDTRSHERTE